MKKRLPQAKPVIRRKSNFKVTVDTLTNKERRDLRKLQERMQHVVLLKKCIGQHRDTLRNEIYEIEQILESLDLGVSELGDGLRSLQAGVDHISELL